MFVIWQQSTQGYVNNMHRPEGTGSGSAIYLYYLCMSSPKPVHFNLQVLPARHIITATPFMELLF